MLCLMPIWGKIPKGRFPIVFLFLSIDPKDVDVNIHPTKKEIRFRDEAGVRQFVLKVIHAQLEASNPHRIQKENEGASAFPTPKAIPIIANHPNLENPEIEHVTSNTPKQERSQAIEKTALSSSESVRSIDADSTSTQTNTVPSTSLKINWVYLRTLKEKYALYETPDGIVMLNILRAKQRIRYEQILEQIRHKSPSKQDLIIPIQIELEPLSASALEAHLNQLNEYGFSIESFGKNFYRILSIPDWLKIEHVEKFVLDLVDQLRTRGSYSKTRTNLFSGSKLHTVRSMSFCFIQKKSMLHHLKNYPLCFSV